MKKELINLDLGKINLLCKIKEERVSITEKRKSNWWFIYITKNKLKYEVKYMCESCHETTDNEIKKDFIIEYI